MTHFKIVMIRHGQSAGNAQNRFCGWLDSKLTDKGKLEATNAGTALKEAGFGFDIVYTSALSRARDTAQIILKELGQNDVPIIETWRLNERHYGALTDLEKNEAIEKYGKENLNIWRTSLQDDPPPAMQPDHPCYASILNTSKQKTDDIPISTGETLKTAIERTVAFWHSTVVPQIKKGKRVLIASHKNPLKGLIAHLEQRRTEEVILFNLPNAVPFVYSLDEACKPVKKFEFLY